jgi:hypothetical protein
VLGYFGSREKDSLSKNATKKCVGIWSFFSHQQVIRKPEGRTPTFESNIFFGPGTKPFVFEPDWKENLLTAGLLSAVI